MNDHAPGAREYVIAGSGDERTLAWNQEEAARVRLRNKVLVDVSAIDTTRLFGETHRPAEGQIYSAVLHARRRERTSTGFARSRRCRWCSRAFFILTTPGWS
jgi:hypothetical protein